MGKVESYYDKTKKVNRLTVIDHRKDGPGIIFENYDVSVDLDYQDSGRTLKVFITDRENLFS
jgi:hypothetical protein